MRASTRPLRAYPQARVGNVAEVSDSDTFGARSTLEVGGESYEIFRLDALQEKYDVARLPYALKVLLENLLRNGEDEGAEAVAKWSAKDEPSQEIAYRPARVLMQDFTGVPAIVDLAAMRDAMEDLGGDATKINPLVPVELVIDHSIQVDVFAERLAFQRNAEFEFERNKRALRLPALGPDGVRQLLGGAAEHRHLPPGEPRVPGARGRVARRPGVPRHAGRAPTRTPRWSTASACSAGAWAASRPRRRCSASRSRCWSRRWSASGSRGELPEGATATDLVLTVTQMLRERGVVGKFVEFYGRGPAEPAAGRPRDDREHVAGDGRHLRDLPGRRGDAPLPRVLGPPAGAHRAGRGVLPRAGPVPRRGLGGGRPTPTRSSSTSATWCPRSPARSARRTAWRSPTRPTDFRAELEEYTGHETPTGYDEAVDESFPSSDPPTNNGGGEAPKVGHSHPQPRHRGGRARGGLRARLRRDRRDHELHQHVEPVGDDRRRPAREEGGRGRARAHAVGQDVAGAGLEGRDRVPRPRRPDRAARRSSASTSSATAAPPASGTRARCRRTSRKEIEERDLVVASVLSGNRNFEGRIHPEVKMNYLASPPLCVAYALAGRMDLDIVNEPLQNDVYLRDIWPTQQEVNETIEQRDRVGHVPRAPTATRCSRATTTGRRSRSRRATATPGTTSRPT